MKLLVDTGNSRIKWAILNGSQLDSSGSANTRQADQSLAERWADLQRPDQVWVSNVAGETIAAAITEFSLEHWQTELQFVAVDSTAHGIRNGYQNIHQLGVDRWVAMVGAWHLTRTACCVVDCGTAVTLDVLDQTGQHQGGLIFPGLHTMRRSLSSNTHALPEVSETPVSLLAQDTRSGIATGCHRAVAACINQTLASAVQEYGQMHCLITGGDAQEILPGLHQDFAHHPQLVLEGLAVYAEGGR